MKISQEDAIKAFEECKTKREICDRFNNKSSVTRFVKRLGEIANVNVDDYFKPSTILTEEKRCLYCGELILGRYKNIKKFCGSSCAAKYNNKQRTLRTNEVLNRTCEGCGCVMSPNINKKYCSNKCQREHEKKQYIERWKNGDESGLSGEYGLSRIIRSYLLEKSHYKCENCGWGEINNFTNTVPLEIHHKDGDYTNNKEDNLVVLCPNCHSLTETHKSHNKEGRKSRKKYYM